MNVCRCPWCEMPMPLGGYMCDYCFADLPWNDQACRGCARPLGQAWLLNGLCAHCTIHPPLLPLSSACLYERPLSHMIGACKYHGQLAYGVFFAELLMYAHLSRSRLGGVDLLIPVPMHPHRIRRRGYNQAYVIAHAWSALCNIPVAHAICTSDYRQSSQVGMSRAQRQANVQGQFYADAAVKGLSVIIVDDVITTGSTMCAVAEALLAAGASSVAGWAVCRQLIGSRG